jgi:UPF0755 protein
MKAGRFGFVLAAGLLAGIMIAAEVHHELSTALRWAAPRPFTVAAGESFEEVVDHLVEEEILRKSRWFPAWARLRGWDKRLRAGRYEIGPGMTPREILETLVEGPRLLQRVTLPEGWRQAEVFEVLRDSLGIGPEELDEASRDTAWLLSLGLPAARLEGYLRPETYHFDPGAHARDVIAHLVEQSLALLTRERRERARALGLEPHEVMTLASIIEAEAKRSEERPRISAVFHNRLRRGWPLQADPTVAYALGKRGADLTSADLKTPSPYNTYLVRGLPPGPIGNPGVAAVDAALHPLEECADLYFVARDDGSHAFSRTLDEHEAARRRIRESRAR